jgi:NodT family efflux transporter outer membrane factor (OMF) lipoprotein
MLRTTAMAAAQGAVSMSSRVGALALLTTALALAGCSAGPRIKPNLALPQAYQAPAAPADMAPAPLDAWWTSFEDPALDDLVETALKASPDARTAVSRVREAVATRRSQFDQAVLPSGQLNGSASKGHSAVDAGFAIPGFTTGGDTKNYSANFNVSWELDLLGRNFDAVRAINAELAAARFDAEASKASLAAQVAQSYFQIRALNVQLGDARESARLSGELADLATRKANYGLGASADADRVAGDLAQSQAQVAALETQLQAARRTLLILIGRGADPVESLALPPAQVVIPAPPATTPGDLLARRPDVREAAARLISATGQLKVAEKAIFPTFNLTPGLSYTKSEQSAFATTTKAWTLGGSVVQPILNIPQLLADMKAQGARTDQAALAYEKAVQTAYGEAENALVQLDSDRRRVALLTDGEVRARRAYNAAQRRYADGIDDLTQAISAEQSWRATRSALTGAQADAQQRVVTAFKALGGGWSPLTDKQARATTEPKS